MSFLPIPHPERVIKLQYPKDFAVIGDYPMLTLGLRLVTVTDTGLKIVPKTYLTLAIGEQDGDAEKVVFDFDFNEARQLAGRIIEMCDAGEAKVTTQ